jgi:acyl-CoA dehydrogenase
MSIGLESAWQMVPLLREHADRVDRDARFPLESMQALRDNGLLGLLVPRAEGGLGGDLDDLVEVARILAGACLSTALIWAMHCQQVDVLCRFAGPRLRQWLLPRIAAGEIYLGSVTTEPGKGGHLLTGVAPLAGDGDGLRIAREGPVVTGGEEADGFLVTMRASEDAADTQVTLVYADRGQLGVTVRNGWDSLGMRGTRSVALRLDGAVADWQVVGEPGQFRTIALESMAPVGHLAWAACWLGAAQGGLADLVSLIRSPARPARLDLRSELVAERIARARIDLELVSAYLRQVCDEVQAHRGRHDSLGTPAVQIHLNTLKIVAAERTFLAVDRLVELAGMSLGYLKDAPIPLERRFRDLRSASLNYANDRLLVATGGLTLQDRGVGLAGFVGTATPSAGDGLVKGDDRAREDR